MTTLVECATNLVQPKSDVSFPAVLVIHENRGLNPHNEDVARRAAIEGFVALAPDGLYPVGGYPGNDVNGRTQQRSLDEPKLLRDLENSAHILKNISFQTVSLVLSDSASAVSSSTISSRSSARTSMRVYRSMVVP